jgi:tetratricopeptide (TPR) repeat protein
MTRSHAPEDRPAPAALADLFAQYLERQTRAQAAGLALPEAAGLVEPYDASPVRPVDPQLAWEDARAVLAHFPDTPPAPDEVPADWAAVVVAQEPAVDLAFCLGNFPQMVRHLQPLLAAGEVAALRRPGPGRPLPVPALLDTGPPARHDPAPALLAAGVLRLARHFDEAEELLGALSREDLAAPWQAVRDNEEAALAWHRGQGEQALVLWEQQAESVPVLFNRGVANLFLGQSDRARTPLARAADVLPESSAWHHLARLYLALA